MRTDLFVLFAVSLVACKNNPATVTTPQTQTVAPAPAVTVVDSAAKVAELSFIDGCVENSKLTLGEPKAFAFCKCMYAQIQSKYPNLDSAGKANLDTATVARMAAACR